MPDPQSSPLQSFLIQLAIVIALVLLNAFFVASEFALVAVRRTRMEQLAETGNRTAQLVADITHDLDRYIAATQVGITIASLLLGSTGERIFEPLFNDLLHYAHFPQELLGITRAAIAFFLAYLIMTTMHVVIGELIPKSIALQRKDKTALFIVRPMLLFARLFAPLIWLLNGLGGLLLRLVGMHTVDENAQVHSPEELDLLFTQSFQGGQLNGTELELLHRVVRFSDRSAREIMVPRVDVSALPEEVSKEDLQKYFYTRPHTRIPVYRGSLDSVIGVVHIKDLMRLENKMHIQDQTTASLKEFLHPVLTVPETLTIDKMLTKFREEHQQFAVVIDEFGGMSGIITMGDLLTQVFGDVPDEFDGEELGIIERDDGAIVFPGNTHIEDINEKYETNFSDDISDTMAGLILDKLGRTARVGDVVQLNDITLKVLGLHRLRITKIEMKRAENESEQE